MKKILAMVLCVAMVLCTMSFGVFAADPRSILIDDTAVPAEVYADDTFDVSVYIYGEDLANAVWELAYEPAYFELISETNTTGVIEGHDYSPSETNTSFADGALLKTYTFKALPQSSQVTGSFTLQNTSAYTWLESMEGTDVVTSSNFVDVTILLKDYDVSVKFDGEDLTGAAPSKDLPYDDATHNLDITVSDEDGNDVTDSVTDITYKFNGQDVPASDFEIKAEGTYEITYTVTPELGYDSVSDTITIIVKKPEYVVEVNLNNVDGADYVNGKKLVLVYTNTDHVYFEYDGNAMHDVTASGYEYVNPVDNSLTSYYHVYAFVTDAIDGGVFSDYYDLVSHNYDGTGVETVTYGSTNINQSTDGKTDIKDITAIYGINYGKDEYFSRTEWQVRFLMADIVRDKCVEGLDINAVITAAYPNN